MDEIHIPLLRAGRHYPGEGFTDCADDVLLPTQMAEVLLLALNVCMPKQYAPEFPILGASKCLHSFGLLQFYIPKSLYMDTNVCILLDALSIFR